jgi:hypothetical protein
MRTVFLALVLLLGLSAVAEAQVRVRGYYRSSGTYVQPHYRSAPNYSRWDNWSTVGNMNPYTGSYGTRWPSYSGSRSYTPYMPYRPYTPYSSSYGAYGWGW